MALAISISDNANGTGAVATVSGSDAGSANTVYCQRTDQSGWSAGGSPVPLYQALKQASLTASTSEALRMIEQGGVRINGERVSDKTRKLDKGTFVIQVGKRKFARVILG